MSLNFRIKDGPDSGLSFDFIPSFDPSSDPFDCDRNGPDVFSVREEAFLFIEPFVARSVLDWKNYRHWGITPISRDVWLEILPRFEELRRDIRGNVRQNVLITKYASAPGLLPPRLNLHRKALLNFLDRFEARVRLLIEHYPCIVIVGV